MNEILVNINTLRQRILRGEEVPPEELAAAFAQLRAARIDTTTKKEESKAIARNRKGEKVTKAPLDLMSLFEDK